jgi:hypothetical protein
MKDEFKVARIKPCKRNIDATPCVVIDQTPDVNFQGPDIIRVHFLCFNKVLQCNSAVLIRHSKYMRAVLPSITESKLTVPFTNVDWANILAVFTKLHQPFFTLPTATLRSSLDMLEINAYFDFVDPVFAQEQVNTLICETQAKSIASFMLGLDSIAETFQLVKRLQRVLQFTSSFELTKNYRDIVMRYIIPNIPCEPRKLLDFFTPEDFVHILTCRDWQYSKQHPLILLEIDKEYDVLDTYHNWLPARILQMRDTEVLVHFYGYTSIWDEWIDKLSSRFAESGRGITDSSLNRIKHINESVINRV